MNPDIIVITGLLLLVFLVSRIRRYMAVKKWRKQLARNEYARVFFKGFWHIGIVRKFKDNGKTVHLLSLTTNETLIVPLKILAPTK